MPSPKTPAATKEPEPKAEPKKSAAQQFIDSGKAELEADGPLTGVELTDRQLTVRFSALGSPTAEQAERAQRVRRAIGQAAQIMVDTAPRCADTSAAIRSLDLASMQAVAAIMRQGR